jgi:hypothetical protein
VTPADAGLPWNLIDCTSVPRGTSNIIEVGKDSPGPSSNDALLPVATQS